MSLQSEFIDYYNLNGIQYTLIYAIYSYPNVILPFLNGNTSQTIGFNTMLLLSFCCIVLAQFIIWFSSTISSSKYLLILIGR